MARLRAVVLSVTALVVIVGCASDPGRPTLPPAPSARPSRSMTPVPPPRLSGHLVFSSDTGGTNEDIFSLDLGTSGSDPVRLTDGGAKAFDPDLSPDGRSIVYRVNPSPASDHADLWLVAADGSAPRNLTDDPALDNWSPAWSPDGSQIAFASTRDGGTLSVWALAPDDGVPRRITRSHGEYPDWSPDGRRIVYAAPHGGSGTYDLWITAADGTGEPADIVTDAGTQFGPAWSPDGAWIAYQSEVSDRWEVWLVRPDGTDAHRVSPDGEDGAWPAWSTDGLLAWSGPGGVHVRDPASGATTIVPVAGGASFLSWGP